MDIFDHKILLKETAMNNCLDDKNDKKYSECKLDCKKPQFLRCKCYYSISNKKLKIENNGIMDLENNTEILERAKNASSELINCITGANKYLKLESYERINYDRSSKDKHKDKDKKNEKFWNKIIEKTPNEAFEELLTVDGKKFSLSNDDFHLQIPKKSGLPDNLEKENQIIFTDGKSNKSLIPIAIGIEFTLLVFFCFCYLIYKIKKKCRTRVYNLNI
ncbi:hypothetical protein M153_2200017108 [Pseudoloma neurophilia]|uniref:Uncharacterized protein n=1 Tax=Pseudoloma neurophilia TaxID=146866 RepID=A0A0R0M168_9MICR|nr:hypothetical protein M153_2200017108 [Pseudoloma neurophilia]